MILYDADGNTTTRIPGINNPTPPVTDPPDFIYNSSGQRAKKAATQTTIFHYDLAGQLIAETDTSGNMIRTYVWLLGQPLAMITADASVYYFHNDHLGTPQKMTDGSGAVVWAADYLPFGQAEVTIGTVENHLRFMGQYFDSETGLHYNYHRYYDPKLGRYLRADPIGLMAGTNLYTYAQGNPIKLTDPEGLVVECYRGRTTYSKWEESNVTEDWEFKGESILLVSVSGTCHWSKYRRGQRTRWKNKWDRCYDTCTRKWWNKLVYIGLQIEDFKIVIDTDITPIRWIMPVAGFAWLYECDRNYRSPFLPDK